MLIVLNRANYRTLPKASCTKLRAISRGKRRKPSFVQHIIVFSQSKKARTYKSRAASAPKSPKHPSTETTDSRAKDQKWMPMRVNDKRESHLFASLEPHRSTLNLTRTIRHQWFSPYVLVCIDEPIHTNPFKMYWYVFGLYLKSVGLY